MAGQAVQRNDSGGGTWTERPGEQLEEVPLPLKSNYHHFIQIFQIVFGLHF